MVKLFISILLLQLGCHSIVCGHNESLQTLSSSSESIPQPLYKSLERLLSNSCKLTSGKNKVLILSSKTAIDPLEKGVIYIYDSDESIFFHFEEGDKLVTTKEDSNLNYLKRVIDFIKHDYDAQTKILEQESLSHSIMDGRSISLLLINNKANEVKLTEFMYVSSLLN